MTSVSNLAEHLLADSAAKNRLLVRRAKSVHFPHPLPVPVPHPRRVPPTRPGPRRPPGGGRVMNGEVLDESRLVGVTLAAVRTREALLTPRPLSTLPVTLN